VTWKDTVQKAAVQAARFALPGIPEGAVRWREDPQRQQDARFPSIVLSTVSLVPDGGIEVYDESTDPAVVSRTFAQRWYWTIQVRVEGWRADSKTSVNPHTVTRNMRFGWRTLAVGRILDDGDDSQPWQSRFPVKLVFNPDQVREVTAPVGGHMLPQYLYEIELSYVEYGVDPESETTLLGATIEGELGGTGPGDLVTIDV
jgi:hypothetical protein